MSQRRPSQDAPSEPAGQAPAPETAMDEALVEIERLRMEVQRLRQSLNDPLAAADPTTSETPIDPRSGAGTKSEDRVAPRKPADVQGPALRSEDDALDRLERLRRSIARARADREQAVADFRDLVRPAREQRRGPGGAAIGGERGDRADRADRADRVDRADPADRVDRGERADSGDRGGAGGAASAPPSRAAFEASTGVRDSRLPTGSEDAAWKSRGDEPRRDEDAAWKSHGAERSRDQDAAWQPRSGEANASGPGAGQPDAIGSGAGAPGEGETTPTTEAGPALFDSAAPMVRRWPWLLLWAALAFVAGGVLYWLSRPQSPPPVVSGETALPGDVAGQPAREGTVGDSEPAAAGGTPGESGASPAQAAGSGSGATSPGRSPALRVELRTVRDAWIRVVVDGRRSLERLVPAGQTLTFGATTLVSVRAGDAGAVLVSVNGAPEAAIGADGQVATRSFTAPDTPGLNPDDVR